MESAALNGVMTAKRVVVAVHMVKVKCSAVHSSDIHSVTAVAEWKESLQLHAFHVSENSVAVSWSLQRQSRCALQPRVFE